MREQIRAEDKQRGSLSVRRQHGGNWLLVKDDAPPETSPYGMGTFAVKVDPVEAPQRDDGFLTPYGVPAATPPLLGRTIDACPEEDSTPFKLRICTRFSVLRRSSSSSGSSSGGRIAEMQADLDVVRFCFKRSELADCDGVIETFAKAREILVAMNITAGDVFDLIQKHVR